MWPEGREPGRGAGQGPGLRAKLGSLNFISKATGSYRTTYAWQDRASWWSPEWDCGGLLRRCGSDQGEKSSGSDAGRAER